MIADGCVDTSLRTTSVVDQTFIDSTFRFVLILPSWAIRLFVTDFRPWNAYVASTVKFFTLLTCRFPRTAVEFVAAVVALELAGALEVSGDALLVVALELVGAAGGVAAEGRALIRAVAAVGVPVAHPRLLDAQQTVLAVELVGRAHARLPPLPAAILFIGAVAAIAIVVAPPLGGDAVAVGAAELGDGVAGVDRAVGLVRFVPAVVVVVADPLLVDAPPVSARELVRATSLVAVLLVGAIGAVGVIVAHPREGDALAWRRATRELVHAAHFGLT